MWISLQERATVRDELEQGHFGLKILEPRPTPICENILDLGHRYAIVDCRRLNHTPLLFDSSPPVATRIIILFHDILIG